jgi:hypothetical protein
LEEGAGGEGGLEQGAQGGDGGGGFCGEESGDGLAVQGEALAGEDGGAGGFGLLERRPAIVPEVGLEEGFGLSFSVRVPTEGTRGLQAIVRDAYFPHDRYCSA